jgi:hypothetical protein
MGKRKLGYRVRDCSREIVEWLTLWLRAIAVSGSPPSRRARASRL